jgi:hypothetical protein
MAEDVSRSWQTRIDRLVDECGCGIGAALALAAMGGYLAAVITTGTWTSIGGLVVRSFGALFLGATIGKLLGIGRARVKLRRALLELREGLPDRSSDSSAAGPAPVRTLSA